MYKKPSSKTEKNIIFIWQEMLLVDKIGVDDNFFELGGNSLLAQKTIAILKKDFNQFIPIKNLYQYPTAAEIAAFIDGKKIQQTLKFAKQQKNNQSREVAIIGMKAMVPGASSLDEFWEMLASGKEGTTFFKKEELDKSLSNDLINDKDYVAARGILDDVANFDSEFFGINPKLAEIMDPQHRVFLELSRDLLETTGYLPAKYDGIIGVYAGCGNNTYFLNNIQSNPAKINAVGSFNVNTVSDKDYIASRTAFQLNLKGPAVGVFSACSTSLLAIAEAVDSIRNNQCDVALAGGVSITSPTNSGHLYQEGAMLSKDGHCKPFDANSTGTVFSDGAGVILLKSLAAAERDGDHIYAVLKGIGVNNDGGNKGSFTAPSAEGQANTIAMAIDDAGIEASAISYIEAHGTATPIGDPIEIEGLSLAFGAQDQKQFCAIGSVKSNFGHLTHAAGVAGIIKTVLALENEKIPASINYQIPNPNIDFANSPFYVNDHLADWTGEKRIAGVSSFGVGGTNVHVILESYKNPAPAEISDSLNIINWSAKQVESNLAYGKRLQKFGEDNPETPLTSIAQTLQKSREDFAVRSFILAGNLTSLTKDLAEKTNGKTHLLKEVKNDFTFLFPGQGAQYPAMGKGLYATYPVFKIAIDECAALISAEINEDFLSILFATENSKLQGTYYTQPALFAVEYALTKLWMSLGVNPTSFIGHSIGEFVAAHFSGIFTLEDAVKVITTRAKIVNEQPKGAMLSVKSTLENITAIIPPSLSIAAINAKESIVLAGETKDVERFAEELKTKSTAHKFLKTSHAFHSSMMDHAVVPFKEIFKNIELKVPKIPILSTVTANWLKDSEATDPDYWAEHLRKTVNFAGAIQTIVSEIDPILIEIGPGAALSAFAKQIGAAVAISGLKTPTNEKAEQIAFLDSVGTAWQYGIEINWSALYQEKAKLELKLPTYAYLKKRHWVEPQNSLPNASFEKTETFETSTEPIAETQPNEGFAIKVKQILELASGVELEHANPDLNFIELGLDSLLLTQVAINLKKEFSLPITFRQLNNELNTINQLVAFLNENLGENQQRVMQQPKSVSFGTADFQLSKEELQELKKPFGATPKIDKHITAVDQVQQDFIKGFTRRYNLKTAKSKQYAQENRAHMADPRVVSGFKPATKEIVYPLVINKSKGSRLWDLDGNEYIDALNGFGSNLLGNQPDFLTEAIKAQIDKGYEIGPQHELAGEVTRLMCEFTGFERSALCNTGSEAVLGAMRIARTITGKNLIVSFSGSYHGINDEVLIRGTKKLKSFPAASGIMPEAVQNMLVLDYGEAESLRIIAERSSEIAAVLVEPVQSRRPEFQPTTFLKKLREITEQQEVILIFDEVITGFRSHPGGAQALFGVKADLATYGKVIGGGLPVGAIAGKKEYLDALDGGFWQYGDQSMPEVGVTYFAGTFVRHPLALAAAKASLQHFKAEGPSLQENLNNNTKYLANALNLICENSQIPIYIAYFSSLWKIKFKEDYAYYELVFALMREKGVHIWDGFPSFLTTAHSDADIDFIIEKFKESVEELLAVHLIPTTENVLADNFLFGELPPVQGAKLGVDLDGNPAWFLANSENPDQYFKIESNG